MKRPLIFLICSLLSAVLFTAQASEFKALAYYSEAQKQYDVCNYDETLTYTQKAISELDGTNLKLQFLLTMAHYEAGNWPEAEAELDRFILITQHDPSVTVVDSDAMPLSPEELQRIANHESRIREAIRDHIVTALIAYSDERFEDAAQDTEDLITALHGTNACLQRLFIMAHFRANHWTEADKTLDTFVGIITEAPSVGIVEINGFTELDDEDAHIIAQVMPIIREKSKQVSRENEALFKAIQGR